MNEAGEAVDTTDQEGEMSDVEAAVATAAAASTDERLAHRGPFQRLLGQPEIGAVIGAITVWTFFWAVTQKFGTVAGAQPVLDVAATLGIMSIAVAMLMIGGEFDLSSGAMTGATGLLVIYLTLEVGELGGAGISYWWAVPISLAFALSLGWWNGLLVERTQLPSFIITLATFFGLQGLKLGFAKLLVDNIQVGPLVSAQTDADGNPLTEMAEVCNPVTGESEMVVRELERTDYAFFQSVFASEWSRNCHTFGSRDTWYSSLILIGIALLVLAVLELNFRRKTPQNPTGLAAFGGGLVLTILGYWQLHETDSVGANTLWGAVIAVGITVGVLGFALWRYEMRTDRGTLDLRTDISRPAGVGVGLVVLGVIFARLFNSNDSERLLSVGNDSVQTVVALLTLVPLALIVVSNVVKRARPEQPRLAGVIVASAATFVVLAILAMLVTEQGMRATLFVGLAAAGILLLAVAAFRAGLTSAMSRTVVLLVLAVVIAWLAYMVQVESNSVKFRAELFTVMLMGALLLAVWAALTLVFDIRRSPDADADRLGRLIALGGMVAIVVGVVIRLLFVTTEELERQIAPAKFSVRILWFLAFAAFATWVLARTKFGSWTFAVGGNQAAARQVGVPAARTKTQLFMIVSGAAWLVGMLLAFRLNSLQASTGDGLEFEYIIAAVVGGNLLTGGYGSALGAAIGAIIMAMARQGIPFALWNTDWRFLFLGVILLLAAIGNRFIKNQADNLRKG